MKKILILLAGLAMALAACTKKEMKDDSAQTERVSWPSVITVATEPVVDAETKSVIAADGAFSWFAGTGETAEKLGIYTNAGFKVYTCTDADTGTFGGDLEGATPSTVAVYPAGIYALSDKTLTVSMPESYEYVATLAKTPMIAQISGSIDNLAFKHIAALLKVSIANVPPTATQLVFETDENVAGEFVISDCTVADAVITNDGGSAKSVAVNFPAAGDFTDKDFFIPIPAGTYDHFNLFLKDENGNKLAGRQFLGKEIERKDLASGRSAIELPRLELSDAIVLNDTQIGLRWSENAFVVTDEAVAADKAPAYTFGIYSDAACTSKLWDWETAKNAAVFTSTPGHVFSGLAPATTYYVKVKDATNGIAAVKAFTTTAAETNFVATSAPAVNDVILNQNFNELLWGGNIYNLSCSTLKNYTSTPFSNASDKTNNSLANGSANLNLFRHAGSGTYSDLKTWLDGTSLGDWKAYCSYAPSGQPNAMGGMIRFGGNSSSGYLVSPSISGIDAVSKVRVTIKAAGYADGQSITVAAFPASLTAVSGSTFYVSTAPLVESDPQPVANNEWNTYNFDILVPAGGRIGIGCPYGESPMKLYLDEVKVTYLGASSDLLQKQVFVSNTQLGVRWSKTAFATPATDISTAWTFGIYSDEACTSNVYGRTFSSNASNKDADYLANESKNSTAFASGVCPGFVFTHLTPNTTYYVKITSGTDESVKAYKTANGDVNMLMTTTASAGDLLLFQDFDEITLNTDFIHNLSACWIGTKGYGTGNYGYPNATNNIAAASDNGNRTIYNAMSNVSNASHAGGVWWSSSSLADWKVYGGEMNHGTGYIKVVNNTRALITPAFNCLSGTATVKVTVSACSTGKVQVEVFPAVVSTGAPNNYLVTTAPLGDPTPQVISVNNYTVQSFSSGSCTIKLEPGQRLGLTGNTDSAQTWLNEVKVELVSYD